MSTTKMVILAVILLIATVLLIYTFKRRKKWTNPKLAAAGDRAYSLITEDERQLSITKSAVNDNSRQVRQEVKISPQWYSYIDKLYRQGYNLYMNVKHPQCQPSFRNYSYFKSLYHRSVYAGKLLHQAEKDIQRKISKLQQMKRNPNNTETKQIENLIKQLGIMQAKFSGQRRNAWNNTHDLKLLIRNKCGTVGANWFAQHETKRKQKYGK